MKFIISKKVLSKGLSKFKSITRQSINILLKIENGMLEIKAGHTEMSLICKYRPDEISSDGETITHANFLYQIAQEMPDKPIVVDQKDNMLQISCGESIFFNLPCIKQNGSGLPDSSEDSFTPVNEFPDLSIDEGDSFSVPVQILRDMVSKVLFAVSADNLRRSFCGAFLHNLEADGGSVRMAGTDGFRIAVAENLLDIQNGNDFADRNKLLQKGILIPKEGLQEILKLCTGRNQDDVVSVKINKSLMNVECNNTRLHLRLIDEEFINYQELCNTEMPNHFSVSRELLLSTLRRAAAIGDNNGVQFKSNGNGTIIVTAESSEKSKWTESIKAACEGEPIHIQFNHRYLIDVLQVLNSETVRIFYNSKMLNVRTGEDNSYRYIMMGLYTA